MLALLLSTVCFSRELGSGEFIPMQITLARAVLQAPLNTTGSDSKKCADSAEIFIRVRGTLSFSSCYTGWEMSE